MSVRQDFIEAYAARWGCEEGYASGLLDHVLEEHAHELAEKIRQGGVRYPVGEFNAARAAGPGRVLEFVQSAIADLIDPEAS